jgi:hypothetical protein
VLDEQKLVRAGETNKTVEFKELWDMLRSTDEIELEKMRYVFD